MGKDGNNFETSKNITFVYYDNMTYPSLFEYYLSTKFKFTFSFHNLMRLKDFYYGIIIDKGGFNGFQTPVNFSPLTIFFFKADEDMNELCFFY